MTSALKHISALCRSLSYLVELDLEPIERTTIVEVPQFAVILSRKIFVNPTARAQAPSLRLWPDGTIRWVASRGRTIGDSSGAPTTTMGIAGDITDRKLTEEQLRQSEERLRLAQLNTGVGIFDWDLQTGFLYSSPELEALYGVPFGGMHCIADFCRRVHPEDLAATDAKRATAIQRHEEICEEFRIVRPDQEERWILCKARATYDASGRPIRLIGNNLDITERKRIELRLRESEARFRRAINGSPITVFTCDTDLRLTWIHNPQPPVTDPNQFIGKRDDELAPGDPMARRLTTAKQRVLESGVPERQELADGL